MSRSGYSDDCENWDLIRWRGAVTSAIKGKRGQQFLRDLAAAINAMPEKRLIADEFQQDGEVCALGCLGRLRGMDLSRIDPEDREAVAQAFGIAPALAVEIMFQNDDDFGRSDTPEQRWRRVRDWVASQQQGTKEILERHG